MQEKLIQKPKRDFALDSLRGIAAMGILVWHYQHFFAINKFTQPFENYLPFLYKSGWIMVDFFFCLSGFIFFKYYQNKISRREISLRKFFILRISRLYPLAFATLICVAALNYLLFHTQGKFFIYQNNNIFTFILNLLFLQSGFLDTDFSFNGPSWSISIEFWIYLIFFWISFKFPKYIKFFTPLIFIFFFITLYYQIDLGLLIFSFEFERGLASFFLGGTTYFLVTKIKSYKINHDFFAFATLTATIIGYIFVEQNFPTNYLAKIEELFNNKILFIALIFHPIIIFCVMISPILNKLFSLKILQFFGDISYSSYLWHIPIQLGIFCLVFIGGFNFDPASKKFFFLYFLTVIFISYLSNKFFEKPLQNKIREKFL